MWEKLSDDGSIHDKDDKYNWSNAFAKIAALNTAGFAGHTDWRLPNRFELETILDLGGSQPAVSSVFNSDCGADCTVTTCSCTSLDYWSSSTYAFDPQTAWFVDFNNGSPSTDYKSRDGYVRAVRGGS